MKNTELYRQLVAHHRRQYQCDPYLVAYAPGRVEVLGNHTDYNEGFVLSAAIDTGILFALSESVRDHCRLFSVNMNEQVTFTPESIEPDLQAAAGWSNYSKGVFKLIQERRKPDRCFDATLCSNLAMGAGLSSSAAIEISTALALSTFYGLDIDLLDLAKIGQRAEREYAGVSCGLLDQLTSLFGRHNALVYTDFRSLNVKPVNMPEQIVFLLCNTKVKHSLVDSEYNERRASCEKAAAFFNQARDREIKALRDVTWAEWEAHQNAMDPMLAKRAAHVIGENERVRKALDLLEHDDMKAFGELMFASHESSITYFENSCPELDFVVSCARDILGVLGARLSGGGFGGSAILLLEKQNLDSVAMALEKAYVEKIGHPAEIRTVLPSDGARMV